MRTTDFHRRRIYHLALAWPLVGLLLFASGCASSRCETPCCPAGQPDLTSGLAEVDRGNVTVDLSAVAQLEALAVPPSDEGRGGESYRSLGPADCQCFAVRASSLGNRLAAERRAVCAQHSAKPRKTERATSLKLQVLAEAEIAARDLSAAQALESYYKLAAAEQGRDNFATSLHELSDVQMKLSQLTGRGLQGITNDGSIERQRFEVSSQLGQLELDRRELNENLRNKLGVPLHEPWWAVWPDTPLAVDATPIDVDTAVAIALQSRSDLRLLRIVLYNTDAETLSAVRAVLAQINGLLGLEPAGSCCCLAKLFGALCHDCSEEMEVATRRAQIAQELAVREAEVAAEVRMAILTIETRLEQVLLARQQLASWNDRLNSLEARSSTGESTFLEISQARIQRLEAEHNLVRQVVAWHLGHVQLKQAQGVLSQECGYGPHAH